jgi:AmmeMemoRadiSam system protein B
VAEYLPRLRLNLDFMPSPDPARPGLVIRDPYHYSDAVLIVPTPLVPCLDCFDGTQTELDLRAQLVQITGQIQVGDVERNLFDSLDEAGFLENDTYRRLRAAREAEFVAEINRPSIFAGSAYPSDPDDLSALMDARVGDAHGERSTIAVAAPHASPDGGWRTYRAAYQTLLPPEQARDKTFVLLGTSHYGAPDRFGLTRKNFVTPYGEARTDSALVEELTAAGDGAVKLEDYCHAVEHSLEFQVVFLQHLYGPDIRIVPILCGPFVKSIYEGGMPEDNENVRRFLDALAEINVREEKRLLWVLGVDMAHIGRRYGDPTVAEAKTGQMLAVERKDRARIDQLVAGDAAAYWDLVQRNKDDLKWCGASPFYTFLRTMPPLSGELLDYDQWQIDPQSVVSFGALRFQRRE